MGLGLAFSLAKAGIGLAGAFGGKKPPPVPWQIGASADNVYQLAGELRGELPAFRAARDEYLAELPTFARRQAGDYTTAATKSRAIADTYEDLFYDGGTDILKRAQKDAQLAGGEGRQREEAAAAREAYQTAFARAMQAQADEAARRGITGGGAALNPRTAALEAAQIAAGENIARLRERRHGENMRLQWIPMASQFGANSIIARQEAGQFEGAAAGALGSVPRETYQFTKAGQDLTGGVIDSYAKAQQMFGNFYNANTNYTNAYNADRAAKFNAVGGAIAGVENDVMRAAGTIISGGAAAPGALTDGAAGTRLAIPSGGNSYTAKARDWNLGQTVFEPAITVRGDWSDAAPQAKITPHSGMSVARGGSNRLPQQWGWGQ